MYAWSQLRRYPPFHLGLATIWTYAYKPRGHLESVDADDYMHMQCAYEYTYMHALICMHPPVQALLLRAAAV